MELVILVGIPGSGKSSLTEKLDGKIVSTDSIRKFLFGKEEIVEHDVLVFHLSKLIVDYYLKKKWTVIFDATNTKRDRRSQYIEVAQRRGANVRIIWVDCSVEVALDRNSKRTRKVPAEVIYSLHWGLEKPSLEEGVDIIEVRDKDMQVIEILTKDV